MRKKTPSHANQCIKNLSDQTVLEIPDDVIFRHNPDRTVSIVSMNADSNLYTIDGIAADVWIAMSGMRALKEIKTQIIKKHGLTELEITTSFKRLLKDLFKHGLVRIAKNRTKPMSSNDV